MRIHKIADKVTDSYLNPDFISKVEDFRRYLVENGNIEMREITPNEANKYKGDFHGLLDFIGIEKTYHYFYTRLNGLESSQDYDGIKTIIILPGIENLTTMHSVHIAKKR
jgi:hypothetical protein